MTNEQETIDKVTDQFRKRIETLQSTDQHSVMAAFHEAMVGMLQLQHEKVADVLMAREGK